MLIVKEQNGQIYVANLSAAVDRNTPGTIDSWMYVGPGNNPIINNVAPNRYILTFDYLSHTFVRVFDLSVTPYPPQIVDPVTTNPYSIQKPEESIPIAYASNSGISHIDVTPTLFPPTKPLLISQLYYDTTSNIYTYYVSRDTSENPSSYLRTGFRLYTKASNVSNWTLSQDWITEITNFQIQHVGPFIDNLTFSLGGLFDPTQPNSSAKLESPFGPILTVDSSKLSKTLQTAVTDTISILDTSNQSTANTYFEPPQKFYVQYINESITQDTNNNYNTITDDSAYDPRRLFILSPPVVTESVSTTNNDVYSIGLNVVLY